MDCHDNHRYHPYAPPTDAHHEMHPGREWYRRDHAPFPNGYRGGQNGRYLSGRRGTGTPRTLDRDHLYQSGRFNERHFDSRFEMPQQRPPPWYPGRSMNYGPPRPATNYPLGNNRVHYRGVRYSPQPRLNFKSIRPASSHPTGQAHVSSVTSSPPTSSAGSPQHINNLKAKATVSVCPSQQTSVSLAQRQTNCNSVGASEPLSLDKQPLAMDIKNPSIAKVVPFSHQPSINNAKSPVGACTPPETDKISPDANLQVRPESQIVSPCGSLPADLEAIISISQGHCRVSEDGLMTIFAPDKDGQLQPICKTICSCQLRKRALKYAGKGETKVDSILIDSDEEDEKNSVAAEDNINQGISEKMLQSCSSVTDKPNGSYQETPRKRAKMSIENTPEKSSFPVDNSATAIGETDASCSMTEVDSVARIVDGLRQSLGEGCSSSTSSDSLLSLSSVNLIEDAPLLANPQILQRLLDECNEIAKPFKKLKVSPRNLYTSAKECNVHKVLALLVGGCDPNHQVVKSKGKTAMHAAAAGGYVDIMACLRLAGCDLNLVDFESRTPLFDAVSNHKFKAVEYLIECGANLAVRDSKGMTCFHVAVRQGHSDLIKLLLKTGQFEINEKDDGGWTPIMWAAEDKQYEATSLLIEQGANVHIRDLELNLPLHWAALSGNIEVCKLLLGENTDINSINKHKETPLHIAAREDNYQCVQLFLSRGADIHIKNKDSHTPLEVSDPNSRGYSLLKVKAELESHQASIRPRILHSDISRGQENVSISCINEIDKEPFPQFTFVKECLEVYNGMINWSISDFEGCKCDRDCRSGKSCVCSESSERQRIWYNEDGLLRGDIQRFDRPLVYECNRMCNCWAYCKNRVVQKGMQYPLQLYRTLRKGWGVRSLAVIPQGSFVCEYTGELIPDSEADDRDDDSYLFDLDCKESTCELFCIDAKNYGNISRFINHSCEPNIFPLRVFINHRDIRFPRIAFFATKDIHLHEEICFNYGDRFWSIKKKEFYCECGTTSCRYRNPNS